MEPRGSGCTVVRMQVKHLPRSWHTQGESTRLLLPGATQHCLGSPWWVKGTCPTRRSRAASQLSVTRGAQRMLSGQRVPHQWHTWRAPRDQIAQHAWV